MPFWSPKTRHWTRTAGCAAHSELEHAADRMREQHWGPRTLDVDLDHLPRRRRRGDSADEVADPAAPVRAQRAFVLVPWLAVDPGGDADRRRPGAPVAQLLADLDSGRTRRSTADRVGSSVDELMGPTRKRDLVAVVVGTAVVGYLLVRVALRWFPPITGGPGCRCWAAPSPSRAGRSTSGQDPRRRDRRRPGPAASAGGCAIGDDRQSIGLDGQCGAGVVAGGGGLPAASPERVAGRGRGHRGRGGGRKCAGAGYRGALATALLQVSGRAAGGRRPDARLTDSFSAPAESP